jgi:hypothetical protein
MTTTQEPEYPAKTDDLVRADNAANLERAQNELAQVERQKADLERRESQARAKLSEAQAAVEDYGPVAPGTGNPVPSGPTEDTATLDPDDERVVGPGAVPGNPDEGDVDLSQDNPDDAVAGGDDDGTDDE